MAKPLITAALLSLLLTLAVAQTAATPATGSTSAVFASPTLGETSEKQLLPEGPFKPWAQDESALPPLKTELGAWIRGRIALPTGAELEPTELEDLAVSPPTLEDVYLELTGN